MPDPERRSISATQSPALLNCSPYVTRWMLWHHFANGTDLGLTEDERMREGKRIQPLVLERAADELRLTVTPHDERYVRKGQLGATRDATVYCPERGPGAVEIKCVFDYRVWMAEWEGGARVPPHIEVQHQQQMLVGDGKESFEWGVIAVWVCASQVYFERSPNSALWSRLRSDAAQFFDDIAARREPDPFGLTIEMGWLEELYPTVPRKVLDLRETEGAEIYARKAATYLRAAAEKRAYHSVTDALRSEFRALARDAETILLPGNAVVKWGKRNRITVSVPGLETEENE